MLITTSLSRILSLQKQLLKKIKSVDGKEYHRKKHTQRIPINRNLPIVTPSHCNPFSKHPWLNTTPLNSPS